MPTATRSLFTTLAIGSLLAGTALAQAPGGVTPPGTSPPAATSPATPPAGATAPGDKSPARQAAPQSAAAPTDVVTSQQPDQWLASRFIGTDVLGADDQKIGDVTDVLLNRDGNVAAVVIAIGGFLGIGAKNIALPLKTFQVAMTPERRETVLRLAMTKDQLMAAADFKPYQPPAPQPATNTGPGRSAPPQRPVTN